MDWGPNSPLWGVVFWINVAACLGLAVIVVRVIRKYEAKRRQLKNDLKEPGMKNLRWLFKHKLKEHDIHEENEQDYNKETDASQN